MQYNVLSIPMLPTLLYGDHGCKRHSLTFFSLDIMHPMKHHKVKYLSCVGGAQNLRVFMAPFNHVFQEAPGLQIPMNFFYCLGIPGVFLKA